MSGLRKDLYNQESLQKLALDIQSVYAPFQVDAFVESILDKTWNGLELKDRVYRIAENLGKYLPPDYGEAIRLIDGVVMHYGTWQVGFGGFFPAYVELFGRDESNWELSMGALARFTPYASAEFAVRPFIIDHEERMMAQMYAWSKDERECVRRLACEGCRPALPWARAFPRFKRDPAPILPILEQLREDPSLYVRRSVANNLNDISKTRPDIVVRLAGEWVGKHAYTDWIVKQGCRTLLKAGNRDVLDLFGFTDAATVGVEDFALAKASVSVGNDLAFSFGITARKAAKVRLEYGIDFAKSNGSYSRKIFRISEGLLKENEGRFYTKKHSFTEGSARKYDLGTHAIALIVNGEECGKLNFELTR